MTINAIIFALLSLVCAACNDLVFKGFAKKKKNLGSYFVIIGIIWFAFFFIQSQNFFSSINSKLLILGLVSGTFGIVANILLLEGMKRCDVGISSTVYRLNLAPAAIIAVFILNESLSVIKVVGVLLAVVSVCMMKPSGQKQSSFSTMGLVILIIACLFRAGMGICFKISSNCGYDSNHLLALNGLMWIVGGVVYYYKDRALQMISKEHLQYGGLSGMLVCGIVLFLTKSLENGPASIIIPISQMSFILTAVLGFFIFREEVTLRKGSALLLGVLAVVTLSVG